ncbi:death domain-associated protein 6 [Rhea pennata]|uniref:death domain-associated protein 6 n=1 Tax=Rhea pennata TaxID=8795 RepID=UPI002E26996A
MRRRALIGRRPRPPRFALYGNMAAPARTAPPGPTSGAAQYGADGGSVWRRSGAGTAPGGGSTRGPSPALGCAAEPAAMAAAAAPGGVIVLDDEEDGAAARPPAAPRPNGAAPASPPPAPAPPQPPTPGRAGGSYKAENERLFAEFLALCTRLTEEHPEVIPFLSGRHQKASAEFLASAELRNVLSRCLSRVRARRNKVYVYINELCTVLKAHTLRRKVPLAAAPAAAAASPPADAGADAGGGAVAAPEAETAGGRSVPLSGGGSKRQIRYLENLLRVYMGEIRRLQERELDLAELDSEDSTYLQESRLKRKMMRIFQRLCQLKQCSSLTGRVIEQRIAYRGTRYPEVNRRIERFINRPEAFPDYADILKVIQKASARHSLGLARRQMESMAQDAFREVGNRLQERRHLDLVYNFGSHLTDQYRPGTDPALLDPELAKRLRKNRAVALTRLDDVISRYAQLQDESEEEERGRKRAARRRAAADDADAAGAAAGSGSPAAAESGAGKSRQDDDEDDEDDEEEEEEEDSEEEDDEDDDSTDAEAELPPGRAAAGTEEEERQEDGAGEATAAQGTGEPPPEPRLAAAEEPRGDGRPAEEEEEEEEEEAARAKEAAGQSPAHELFVLEIETLPLEPGETPPPSPQAPGGSEATPKAAPASPEPSEATPLAPPSPEAVSSRTVTAAAAAERPERAEERCALRVRPAAKRKRPTAVASRPLENGAGGTISSTSFNGSVVATPGRKRRRLEPASGAGPCVEVHSVGSEEEEEEEEEAEGGSGPPRPSPLPDSTRADSPGQGLVSSSQGSPRRLPPKACKTSVATQCDPEEIIVLSDSD